MVSGGQDAAMVEQGSIGSWDVCCACPHGPSIHDCILNRGLIDPPPPAKTEDERRIWFRYFKLIPIIFQKVIQLDHIFALPAKTEDERRMRA